MHGSMIGLSNKLRAPTPSVSVITIGCPVMFRVTLALY